VRIFLSILCLCAASALAGEPPSHRIRPSAADDRVVIANAAHLLYPPVGRARGALVVFLPGTFGTPDGYREFLAFSAREGFHALGLSYLNERTIGGVCRGQPDCFGQLREAVLDGHPVKGIGYSDSATEENGIEPRLARVLRYAADHFPAEGWGQYLDERGLPRFERMIVAGHSQGGGQALLLAERHRVLRAVSFAAPADGTKVLGSFEAAPWLSAKSATSASDLFAFDNVNDFAFEENSAGWAALGLTRWPVANLDEAALPRFAASGTPHVVLSHRNFGGLLRSRMSGHNSVVLDRSLPRDSSGEPIYAPIWRYLLGASR
jgi:pimeloyl-ACP methyl ester carboxylesterase